MRVYYTQNEKTSSLNGEQKPLLGLGEVLGGNYGALGGS
jgi:hypothetical protein